MTDNRMSMKLLTALSLALVLSACSQGFSPAGSGANPAHLAGSDEGGGGDVAVLGGAPGSDNGPAGSPADGGPRPKADPEFIAPMVAPGGQTVTITGFQALEGFSLTHPLGTGLPKSLSIFPGESAALRLLVQANTAPVDAPQWINLQAGHVRVVLEPAGVAPNDYTFCDVPVAMAADGSNLNAVLDIVQPLSFLLYYRESPYPAPQWVDCSAPVSFSSVSATAYPDFTGNVNPIEYLGSYRVTFKSPPTTGGLPE
jgi:hypothetical protein